MNEQSFAFSIKWVATFFFFFNNICIEQNKIVWHNKQLVQVALKSKLPTMTLIYSSNIIKYFLCLWIE